ncbi:MAG: M81 family metallopeptidase [Chloroflexota bacterium]|nr:M81 family metallopeptidase [Chloroflexota bacterium]
MKLALLGIYHETNTFSRVKADYDAFNIYRGEEIIDEYRLAQTTNAGFLQISEDAQVDVIPLIFAITGPIGTITADAFESISKEMLSLLNENGPWDGILLSLHGAAVSEEYPDADGEIAERVRTLVGPDVKIGLSVDMHANLSQKMITNVDVATVYRTNPHLDPKVRAFECAEMIRDSIDGKINPVMWLEIPPVVINIVKQFTDENPMKAVMENLDAALAMENIIHASVSEGYPYADVEEMGMGFLAIADGNTDSARKASQWMAAEAWDIREQFLGDTPSIEEALAYADVNYDGEGTGPMVLMDVGDNIGGGSSADSTHILEVAQAMRIKGYLQTLFDPESARMCADAGVGSHLKLTVGGKTDNMHGNPVSVSGIVRTLFSGKFEDDRPTHGGFKYYDGGLTAVFDTEDGHTLVLTSLRCGNTSREQMYSVGVYPEKYRIVVAKGVVSPRPAYQPIAKEVVLVNTPGVTTSDLNFFEYRRRRPNLYPFEESAIYLQD